MNNPEYIVTDEFGTLVTAVKATLGLPVLNYQFGYRRELDETLMQWAQNPEFSALKFPLVFLEQPFTIRRGVNGMYGLLDNASIFILNETAKDKKAAQRMEDNFKPILNPIYRELLNQINNSGVFTSASGRPGDTNIQHEVTDIYYWEGIAQQFLTDAVDAKVISRLQLNIYDNENCVTFKSF